MPNKLIMGNHACSSWPLPGPFGFEFDSEAVQFYLPSCKHLLDEYYQAATAPALQVAEGLQTFGC